MTSKESPESTLDAVANESQQLSILLQRADLSPVPAHMLLKPHAARKEMRASAMENIDVLTQALDQIRVIEQSIVAVRANISSIRTSLVLAIAPIGALPLELIQHIMQFSIESPEHRSQIIRLSHVSRTWRTAILGISNLFVSPNWARWPRETVDEWCSRAGTHPLNAFVRSNELPDGNPSEMFRQVCLSMIPYLARVGALKLELGWMENESDHNLILAVSYLFEQPMPCLRRLTMVATETNFTNYPDLLSEHLPLLTTLHTAGFNPNAGDSFYQLANLRWEIMNPRDCQSLADFLRRQMWITHLTILDWEYSAFGGDDEVSPSLSLISARSLRLCGFHPGSAQFLGRLLPLMSAPRLRLLELEQNHKTLYDIIFRALPARTSFSIESLVVVLDPSANVRDVLEPLIQTHDGARAPLPCLRELVIQTVPGYTPPVDEDIADLLRNFVEMREGKLQLLALPTLPEPALMDALRTLGVLEIRDHHVLDDHDL